MANPETHCDVTIEPDVYEFLEARAAEKQIPLDDLMRVILTNHAVMNGLGSRTLYDRAYALLGGGPKTVASLSDALGATPSTVRSILSTLRRKGLVESKSNPDGPGKVWEQA